MRKRYDSQVQLRSWAGSKIADNESKAEIPLDDSPEVTPLLHPEQPQIESTDSQADSTQVVPPKPQDLVPKCVHNRRTR